MLWLPAWVKFRGVRQAEREYDDGRADKGYHFVIEQQKQENTLLRDTLVEERCSFETRWQELNNKYVESVKAVERLSVLNQTQAAELLIQREKNDQLAGELKTLQAEVRRLEQHDRANKEQLQITTGDLAQIKASLEQKPK